MCIPLIIFDNIFLGSPESSYIHKIERGPVCILNGYAFWFSPANAILDEITLGTAYPDVWVNLNTDASSAHPGDQFNFQLDYGNHAGVLASSSIITLTLPAELDFLSATVQPEIIGDMLVWQVGDLPAGTGYLDISLTVEVDSAASLAHTFMTYVEISTSSFELELMNNTNNMVYTWAIKIYTRSYGNNVNSMHQFKMSTIYSYCAG